MRGAVGLLLACAIVVSAPIHASADDAADRAAGRRHFERGEQLFQRGDFTHALEEYEAGYRITRLPGFIINVAHCHRLMGDLRKARAHYRRYLLIAPASTRKSEVEEMIASLDQTIAAEDGDTAAAPPKQRTPSVRWWLWSAVASSLVGSTVATMALAASEDRRPPANPSLSPPLVDAPTARQ
jgi:tetratricopeptide (TPR) repeat protein